MTLPPQTPVELVPVAELKAHPDNPRQIDPDQRAHLATRLQAAPAMLWARPLIRQASTGYVVAGNQRLLVATEDLHLDALPCATFDLDEKTAREWAITDNNGYGDYEHAALREYLLAMDDLGTDLDTLGFKPAELERLLAELDTAPEPDDPPAGAPPADPVTKPGDLILLGRHRLLCGDAHEPAHLDIAIADAEIGCVLTDPPYGINLAERMSSPMTSGLGVPQHETAAIKGDDQPFDAALLAATFAGVAEQFWFGANYYQRTLRPTDLDGSWLVWDKRTETSDAGFGSGFELIWSRTPHKQDLLRHLYFGAYGPEARDRLHESQKPTPLLREILDRWAPADCTVADPFLGSGSTLIACEDTGRACIGLEIDPAYCDVIVDRWQEHTGEQAIRP